MGKYMGWLYSKMGTKELRVLKSKKYVQLQTLNVQASYFTKRERETLTEQITWINAELESRRLQEQLPF